MVVRILRVCVPQLQSNNLSIIHMRILGSGGLGVSPKHLGFDVSVDLFECAPLYDQIRFRYAPLI